MEINTIKIGDVEIKQTAALAPMASVADRAYRLVCKEHGAAYMVSAFIAVPVNIAPEPVVFHSLLLRILSRVSLYFITRPQGISVLFEFSKL